MGFLTTNSISVLFNNFVYLLIFGCAGFLLLHGLSSNCSKQGLLSGYGVWASHCGGFPCCGLGARVHGLQQLQHKGPAL